MNERAEETQTMHDEGSQIIDWQSKRTWSSVFRFSGLLGTISGVSLVVGYSITHTALELKENWQIDVVSWMIALLSAVLALYVCKKIFTLPTDKELIQIKDIPSQGAIHYITMVLWFLIISFLCTVIAILFSLISGIIIPLTSVPIISLPTAGAWWKALLQILRTHPTNE